MALERKNTASLHPFLSSLQKRKPDHHKAARQPKTDLSTTCFASVKQNLYIAMLGLRLIYLKGMEYSHESTAQGYP